MRNVMGIIDACSTAEALGELTLHRPAAAVPFAANYRLIDFILSSMVNSGISNLGVLVSKDKYSSLIDHLGSGKEWDLDRKNDGLFVFPSDINCEEYFKRSKQEYVIISGSDIVCNLNFLLPFNFHREVQADITILYKEIPADEKLKNNIVLEVNNEGRVTEMKRYRSLENQEDNENKSGDSQKGKNKVFLGMAIISKPLLINLTGGYSAKNLKDYKEAIADNVKNLKVYSYPYWGYMAKIDTIESYYHHSLELLKTDVGSELFFQADLIHTKVKDEPPVKYNSGACVKSSLIANGCKIFGEVTNSILSRGVLISKRAKVVNSIIMAKSIIDEGATVENCILDKEVYVTKGKILRGDFQKPLLIKKGVVI